MKIKYLGGGWVDDKTRYDNDKFLLTVGKVYETLPYEYPTEFKVIGDCGYIIYMEREFFEVVNETTKSPREIELENTLEKCKTFFDSLYGKVEYDIWRDMYEMKRSITSALDS